MYRIFQRCLHSSSIYYNEINKNLLSSLRKKTGYPFMHCKKALEISNNDIAKAEEWLNIEAQKAGWEKAAKVQGRATKQGLIGLKIKESIGIMVEVNCETDFVSRNNNFHELVAKVTNSCFQHSQSRVPSNQPFEKWHLSADQLNVLPHDSKSLADLIALSVGQLGENIAIARAVGMQAREGVTLDGCSHSVGGATDRFGDVLLGKYASLLSYQQIGDAHLEALEIPITEFSRQLCQHIIGMNPKEIGKKTDEPNPDKELESRLIFQNFLLDQEVSVGEIISEAGIEILDFQRLECGEMEVEANAKQEAQ